MELGWEGDGGLVSGGEAQGGLYAHCVLLRIKLMLSNTLPLLDNALLVYILLYKKHFRKYFIHINDNCK